MAHRLDQELFYYLNMVDRLERGDAERFIPTGVRAEEKAELEKWLRVNINVQRYVNSVSQQIARGVAAMKDIEF